MKLFSTIAAGAIAAAALVSVAPAGAQTRVVRTRTVVTHRTVRPHHYRTRRVCHTYYNHHRRYRRCRVERY